MLGTLPDSSAASNAGVIVLAGAWPLVAWAGAVACAAVCPLSLAWSWLIVERPSPPPGCAILRFWYDVYPSGLTGDSADKIHATPVG